MGRGTPDPGRSERAATPGSGRRQRPRRPVHHPSARRGRRVNPSSAVASTGCGSGPGAGRWGVHPPTGPWRSFDIRATSPRGSAFLPPVKPVTAEMSGSRFPAGSSGGSAPRPPVGRDGKVRLPRKPSQCVGPFGGAGHPPSGLSTRRTPHHPCLGHFLGLPDTSRHHRGTD